jgi:hypothetical protein
MLGSLKNFLQRFPDCRFREFDIRDLLPPPYVQSLKSASPPAPIVRNRFFQIERQRGGRLSSQLVAFPYQPGRTYAFFRDTGDKLEGAAKFFLFHEIGHSLYKAVSPYEGIYVGRMLLIFFPIWHILTHGWSSASWTTYFAFGYMVFCYIFLGNQHSRSNFSVEVQADALPVGSWIPLTSRTYGNTSTLTDFPTKIFRKFGTAYDEQNWTKTFSYARRGNIRIRSISTGDLVLLASCSS